MKLAISQDISIHPMSGPNFPSDGDNVYSVASLVVPALISLLEMINSAILAGDISEIEERRWFRVLSNKLKDNGYLTIGPNTGFTDSTLLIAQKLIGHPLLLGMRGLSNILEDTGEDE